MTGMSPGPLPGHGMGQRGISQSSPELVILLLPVQAVQCINDISRIGYHLDLAGIFQGFQTDRRRDDLGLVVRSAPQVFAHHAVMSFAVVGAVTQNRNRACPSSNVTIAQRAPVACYCNLLHLRVRISKDTRTLSSAPAL